eukprot:768657-Hanusia_phi.AAC.8
MSISPDVLIGHKDTQDQIVSGEKIADANYQKDVDIANKEADQRFFDIWSSIAENIYTFFKELLTWIWDNSKDITSGIYDAFVRLLEGFVATVKWFGDKFESLLLFFGKETSDVVKFAIAIVVSLFHTQSGQTVNNYYYTYVTNNNQNQQQQQPSVFVYNNANQEQDPEKQKSQQQDDELLQKQNEEPTKPTSLGNWWDSILYSINSMIANMYGIFGEPTPAITIKRPVYGAGRCDEVNFIRSGTSCVDTTRIQDIIWKLDCRSTDYNKLPDSLKKKENESITIPYIEDGGYYVPDCNNSFYTNTKEPTNLLENVDRKRCRYIPVPATGYEGELLRSGIKIDSYRKIT